jgi:hypothetical protein
MKKVYIPRSSREKVEACLKLIKYGESQASTNQQKEPETVTISDFTKLINWIFGL